MLFICYPACTTCRKAQSWLQENWPNFVFRDIKTQNPTLEELSLWQQRSGLAPEKFFNTSGRLYRELDLKNRLKTMGKEEMLSLLSSDGMLVKRPLLITEQDVLVGFRPEQWEGLREKMILNQNSSATADR